MSTTGEDIQIERGNFTRIHNAILEQLASHDFSSREYACILYLLRMTYGFNRKDCTLSNGDFANATKLDRTAIIKTLRRLVERNVITKDDGDPYHAATWSFNKYFEQWDTQTSVKTTTISSVETTSSQDDTSSCFDTTSSSQNDTSASVETTTTSSVKTTTSYISAKDNKDSIKDKEIAAAPQPVDDGWKVVCNAYQDNIGAFTSITSDLVHDAYTEFGERVVVAAIKEAVVNNKRKWSYVDGILRGWRANGRAERMRKEDEPKVKKKMWVLDANGNRMHEVQL